jgi:Domain of unknown function (DUF4124)
MFALASHLPDSRNADASLARIDGYFRVLGLVPAFLILLAPATAWGDIYKWTDERGNLVISNAQPVNGNGVSGVELLATAAKPATQSPVTPSQQTVTPTEQVLEARIENLERQLQEQQYAQQPLGPQSSYSGDYYPAPAPPPPEPSYYSSYDQGYYPSFYNPWPPSYSFIVVPPRTFVRRPAFVNRPHFVNRPPVFAGRSPVFTGRSPVFTGRPPVFTGRPPLFVGRPPVFASQSPAFASRPALGFSRSAAFGGGSMHRGRR